MKKISWSQRLSIILLLVLSASIFGSVVHAQDSETTVEVFRLSDYYVGIKVTFPTEVGGGLGGVILEKYFHCLAIPTHTLYCIGKYRKGSDPTLLTLYDEESGEIVLQEVINSPK